MSDPSDAPRMSKLEHAVADCFASSSTSVVHAIGPTGKLTLHVSWVRAPRQSNLDEERCAVDLVLAPGVPGRYAALDTAARLRFDARVCDAAKRAVDAQVEDASTDCSASVDVTPSMIDDAARGGE